MSLSPTLYQEIHTELVRRFDLGGLQRMIRFHFANIRLAEIASPRANLNEIVYNLLDYAEENNLVENLLQAAAIERPRVAKFKTLVSQYQTHLQTTQNITMSDTNQIPRWHQQRLHDLERNIARDAELLADYEEELSYEDDPRRMRRIKREIARQKRSLADYRGQFAKLMSEGSTVNNAESSETSVKLDQMQAQIAGMEERLSAKMDANQITLVTLLNGLSVEQRAVSNQLIDLVEQGQLAQEQGNEIMKLVQRALVYLHRAPQPDYWQRLEKAVNEQTSVAGKLKLMIPIIPTILEYETELTRELLPDLQSMWRSLKARVTGA